LMVALIHQRQARGQRHLQYNTSLTQAFIIMVL
jgi:hypothetical protein